MKNFILLPFGILCCLPGIAQKNYKKAVFYTKSGDSISCYVKDKEWILTPSSFNIKRTPEGKTETLNVADISRIDIENSDHYVAAKVNVDITPSEFETSFIDPALIKSEEADVFLLVEYSGKSFGLFSLRKNNRNHFYLQKDGKLYEELIFRHVTLTGNGTVYESDDKTYISQLEEAFADCEKAAANSKRTSYSSGDFIKILKVYDKECGHQAAQYVNDKIPTGKLSVVILAGGSISKTVFKSDDPGSTQGLVTKNPLKADPSFSAGIRLNLISLKMHKKFSFLLDLNYTSYKATVTEITSSISDDFYNKETLNIHPSFIRSNLMGRYYFIENGLRPFVQGGLVFAYAFNHKDEVIKDDHYNQTSHITTSDAYRASGYQKVQGGYVAGAGLEYKRVSVDYKYEHTNGFANGVGLKSSIALQTITIGFAINK